MPSKSSKARREPTEPLLQRFSWILENKRTQEGAAWSARSLSIAAGLSHAHLGNMFRGEQSADIGLDTATAYARAADVRVEWLMSGDGAPGQFAEPVRATFVEPDADPDPTREEAIALVGHRYKPNVIASVRRRRFDVGDTPKGVRYWVQQIREAWELDQEDERLQTATTGGEPSPAPTTSTEDLKRIASEKKGSKKR